METVKIEYAISKKVLVISEDIRGKGGVVSVVKTLSSYYECFNFIFSTTQNNFISKLFAFLRCILCLINSILFKSVKIVHIHTAAHGSFVRKSILALISKLLGVKVILHIHGSSFKDFYIKYNYGRWINKVLDKVDLIIVLSISWEEYFKNVIDTRTKTTLLNNIIPIPVGNSKVKCLSPNTKIELLFLGLIGNRKGIFELLKVIDNSRESYEDKVLLHIGGNGEVEQLLSEILDRNLKNLVVYEGWVDTEKKIDLLSRSHVYILPSHNEGLPISILEAMSYGMPIISTSVGGIPEVVHDNLNGYIVEPGNMDQLKKAIDNFMNNPTLVESMGEYSKLLIKPFYPNVVIPTLNNIYKELLQ